MPYKVDPILAQLSSDTAIASIYPRAEIVLEKWGGAQILGFVVVGRRVKTALTLT